MNNIDLIIDGLYNRLERYGRRGAGCDRIRAAIVQELTQLLWMSERTGGLR